MDFIMIEIMSWARDMICRAPEILCRAHEIWYVVHPRYYVVRTAWFFNKKYFEYLNIPPYQCLYFPLHSAEYTCSKILTGSWRHGTESWKMFSMDIRCIIQENTYSIQEQTYTYEYGCVKNFIAKPTTCILHEAFYELFLVIF